MYSRFDMVNVYVMKRLHMKSSEFGKQTQQRNI